eukprot:1187432-Prorocentrum_minimum.AAC.4
MSCGLWLQTDWATDCVARVDALHHVYVAAAWCSSDGSTSCRPDWTLSIPGRVRVHLRSAAPDNRRRHRYRAGAPDGLANQTSHTNSTPPEANLTPPEANLSPPEANSTPPEVARSVAQTRGLVLAVYIRSKAVPAYVLILLALSKRVHSIFVLRLFNDGVAMLLAYIAVFVLQVGVTTGLFNDGVAMLPVYIAVFALQGGPAVAHGAAGVQRGGVGKDERAANGALAAAAHAQVHFALEHRPRARRGRRASGARRQRSKNATAQVRYALLNCVQLRAVPQCGGLLRVYSLSPSAIGARYGYILSPLPRLVPATGIFSLPFRDWCLLRVYSLPPSAIGARYGYILSPLPRSLKRALR